jgi:hypothetical protein
MVFDVSVAMTWILFLALFPMAFFWLRRAWRIAFRRDFSEVALKRGEPPPDAERWAPYAVAINGLAHGGGAVRHRGGGAGAHALRALDGDRRQHHLVKFMLDFALSRHAHGFGPGKKA